MPIVRRKLDANTVYPANLRYDPDTDTVQSNVNGDWVDNPDADPRRQTTLPARITSDPACDAAESVKHAIHGQIDQILEAIDNASTLFTIAGIILSIFTFGAYALFVSLALGISDQMVGFGSAAISAALTEPVYDTFKCILYCHFEDNGRLESGSLPEIFTDINAQIGGIGATILNAMLMLAGEGGVNNLAALGASTGDCSLCECGCGDEEIAFSLVVFFGTEIERTGCNIKASGANDGGHEAVTITWDGSHPWVLDREGLLSGDTGTSHWQWYTFDGTEHGPFTGGSAPIGETVTTIELFGDPGHSFSTSWDVSTPAP